MADFAKAFAETMTHEGGYVNDPADRGGETYMGISRRNWPGWAGWPIVDRLKGTPGFERLLSQDAGLQEQVRSFYRTNFWAPIMGDQITSQLLAEEAFCVAVNMGLPWAVRFMQRAVGGTLVVDGRMGPATLTAVNRRGDALVEPFRAHWRDRYIDIVAANPSQVMFLKGWLRRTGVQIA